MIGRFFQKGLIAAGDTAFEKASLTDKARLLVKVKKLAGTPRIEGTRILRCSSRSIFMTRSRTRFSPVEMGGLRAIFT